MKSALMIILLSTTFGIQARVPGDSDFKSIDKSVPDSIRRRIKVPEEFTLSEKSIEELEWIHDKLDTAEVLGVFIAIGNFKEFFDIIISGPGANELYSISTKDWEHAARSIYRDYPSIVNGVIKREINRINYFCKTQNWGRDDIKFWDTMLNLFNGSMK